MSSKTTSSLQRTPACSPSGVSLFLRSADADAPLASNSLTSTSSRVGGHLFRSSSRRSPTLMRLHRRCRLQDKHVALGLRLAVAPPIDQRAISRRHLQVLVGRIDRGVRHIQRRGCRARCHFAALVAHCRHPDRAARDPSESPRPRFIPECRNLPSFWHTKQGYSRSCMRDRRCHFISEMVHMSIRCTH